MLLLIKGNGWDYKTEVKRWVDNGKNTNDESFINGVSGIVNRGCHNPPCPGGIGDTD
eukprot:Pgem_evm2s20163